MNRKKFPALALAALLLLPLSACGEAPVEDEAPAGTAVETVTVETGDIATASTVTGSVTASRNVPVLSKVACEVKAVKIKAGDAVSAGDVLYTLDTSDLQDTYGTALTTYTSTRELLDEQVRQTQQSCANLQALFELGAVSQNQLDQAKLGLMQAENTRDSTLAQMGLDDVWDVINNPAVTAPIAGTIASVSVIAGVTVAPNTATVVVSEIGRPQVVVNVSETLQPSIGVGDAVEIDIPSIAGAPITGVVASVASAVSQNTALYEVHIDLPEDLKVSIGMFARATFHTDARLGTVLVPTEAILTGNDGSQYLFIADGGTAYRIDVTTGLVGETRTEITSGLHGGEQLVTRGQSYLSDGAPIRVTIADGEAVREAPAADPGAASSSQAAGSTPAASAPEAPKDVAASASAPLDDGAAKRAEGSSK